MRTTVAQTGDKSARQASKATPKQHYKPSDRRDRECPGMLSHLVVRRPKCWFTTGELII
jgi:hypothetical protein